MITGLRRWVLGIDHTDLTYKMAYSQTLGTNDVLKLDTTGILDLYAQGDLTINPAFGGSGETPAGVRVSSNDDVTIVSGTGGTPLAGAKVTLAAWNGSQWRSVVETANRASAEPILSLVRVAGTVGIGTAAPTARLQVHESSGSVDNSAGGGHFQCGCGRCVAPIYRQGGKRGN